LDVILSEVTLEKSDVFRIAENKNKSYPIPQEFSGESQLDYKRPKGGCLCCGGSTKKVVDKPFRIYFQRHPSKKANTEPDTAFHFDNETDYKKMLDNLKVLSLLENIGKEKLFSRLKTQFSVVRMRQALRRVAISEKERKELLAKQSREKQLLEDEMKKREREEKMIDVILNSQRIMTYDEDCMVILQKSWREKAVFQANREIPFTKEDFRILFNVLEIEPSVNNPKIILKVEPGTETSGEVTLNGEILNQEKILNWQASTPSSATFSNLHIQDNFSETSEDLQNSKNTKINIQVTDAYNNPKAYYTTSLRAFRIASKLGKNVWVCLKPNNELQGTYPLIHFRVETSPSSSVDGRPGLNSRGNPQRFNDDARINSRLYLFNDNIKYVEDTYYQHKFKFPPITSALENQKYDLLRRYYQNSTENLNLLEKNATIMSELLDDLIDNLPNKNEEDESQPLQLITDQDDLMSMLAPLTFRSETPRLRARRVAGEKFNRVVSYLLKRDLWESKEGWEGFYNQLENLCKSGVPPQYRLGAWSEMSRVIYFISVTEEVFAERENLQTIDENAEKTKFGEEIEEDFTSRSENAYKTVLKRIQDNLSVSHQNLEDDILYLRELFGYEKIPYENQIRNICRAFITWVTQFSDPEKYEKFGHRITYSRTVTILCYALLVCQNFDFREGNEGKEEDRVFWLLIALSCYTFSCYFETNENPAQVDNLTLKKLKKDVSRKKHNLTNSASQCNLIRGVKSDLLLLKILLKDYQPEIDTKIQELGLPLEYYFGDHMLNLLFTLFSPGIAFRVWDILFFEGTSAHQPKWNRTVVCLLYNILVQCKGQILTAKNATDLSTIIDLYAKFQIDSKEFFKQVDETCSYFFEKKLPKTDSLRDKWQLIQDVFINKSFDNPLDNQILNHEEIFKKNFQNTLKQNKATLKFIKERSENNRALFSYNSLSSLITTFAQHYRLGEMKIDEFSKTLSELEPFITRTDHSKIKDICTAISKTNKNNTFFASDFFILLIINNRNTTIHQKFSLIYELFTIFGEISLESLTQVVRKLYEIFMVDILPNQLENIVEQSLINNHQSTPDNMSQITKDQFIQILEGLPLLNYFISLENIDSFAYKIPSKNTKYTVVLAGETVYSINLSLPLSYDPEAEHIPQKKGRFQDYLNRWTDFTQRANRKLQSSARLDQSSYKRERFAGIYGDTPPEKLDIYLPYSKILKKIKKSLIREIIEIVSPFFKDLKIYHPQLYDELLYGLDSEVSIKINGEITPQRIFAHQSSPFSTFLDLPQTVSDIEVIFNLKKAIISDPCVEPYNSLAKLNSESGEWAACKISYKFILEQNQSSKIDGYGVVFQRDPRQTVLKKVSEVSVNGKTDLNNLELRRIEERRENKIHQISNLHQKRPFTSDICL